MFRYSTVTERYNFSSLNGITFSFLLGFEFSSSCNASYYVMDSGADKVYILNDDWSYVTYKTFTRPAYMITIGSSIYMTGGVNIWKLDKDLNILIQYNSYVTAPDNPGYRGMYFNSSNGIIYVAPNNLKEIHAFYLSITYSHIISVPYKPFSISEYKNIMYVGTTNGIVILIQNELIINQFNGCNGTSVTLTYILFDQYDCMATICSDPTNKLYLYNTDGTYTGTNLSTPSKPRYIGFDTKGRFVLISTNQIIIYN